MTETENWMREGENGEQYGDLKQVRVRLIIPKGSVIIQLHIVIV